MANEIKVNGNIEDALRKFKRQCARNGVIQEVRKREHYEKPSFNLKELISSFFALYKIPNFHKQGI